MVVPWGSVVDTAGAGEKVAMTWTQNLGVGESGLVLRDGGSDAGPSGEVDKGKVCLSAAGSRGSRETVRRCRVVMKGTAWIPGRRVDLASVRGVAALVLGRIELPRVRLPEQRR